MLGRTERELRLSMTSAEFTDWLAYMKLERMDRLDALEAGAQPVVIVDAVEG